MRWPRTNERWLVKPSQDAAATVRYERETLNVMQAMWTDQPRERLPEWSRKLACGMCKPCRIERLGDDSESFAGAAAYRCVDAAIMPVQQALSLETLHQIALGGDTPVQLSRIDALGLTLLDRPIHWCSDHHRR